MRLAEAVRIGGRLALVIGFVLANLVFGNSLSYYYGYSSADFGSSQSADAFASQNVNFTPQVSMVTSQNQDSNSFAQTAAASAALSTGGFTVLANVYGYSTPATVAATYTAVSTSTSVGGGTWNPVSVTSTGFANLSNSWNPNATPYAPPSASTTQTYTPMTTYSNSYIGGWYTIPSAPMTPISTNSPDSTTPTNNWSNPLGGAWAAVNMSVIPTVANAITTPVTIPSVVVSTTPPTSINLNNFSPDTPLGAPEPGTLLTLSAGLAFVFVKLRRR